MTLTVLITGVGAAGTIGTLYSLRPIKGLRTVGVDINPDVVGKYLCDRFYQVSRPRESTFLGEIMDICAKEHVDVVLPQVNEEIYRMSMIRHVQKITVSDPRVVSEMGNKAVLMETAENAGIPTPKRFTVDTSDQLIQALYALGYPKKKVVIKPAISRGMIGFRIIDDTVDATQSFYADKPEQAGIRVRRDQLSFLGAKFQPLIAMEYLPGKEYSVDVLSRKGEAIVVVPRTRDAMRTGITWVGTTENNKEVIEYASKLTEKTGLEYAHGYQFKLDEEGTPKLLECNPRIQGSMVLSTFAGANIIHGAVQLLLDEPLPEFNVKWGARLFRDWGSIAVLDNEKIGSC